jgi:predicted TIM-barrel fold metal-dependent hydrolase
MTSALGATDRVLLFSSDCHGGLQPEHYAPWLESAYHDELERYIRRNDARLGDTTAIHKNAPDRERRVAYATDLAFRLAELESQGYVGEVIYPDEAGENEIPFTGYFGGPAHHPIELYAAALRAYNRWLGEAATSGRQLGLMLVPLHSPDYARREVERARDAGLRGIMPAFDGLDRTTQFCDAKYDAVWAACTAENLAVHFHVGSGTPWAISDLDPSAKGVNRFEGMLWCHRPLWQMVFGGVLERHPELRLVFAETFSDWMPRAFDAMDGSWDRLDDRSACPRRPSEYRSQVFLGSSLLSLRELEIRDEIGVDSMMFGPDYPHARGPWSCTTQYLRMTLGELHVPEHEARAIVGENIVRLYDLDVQALASIAEQVGPTIDEILAPPTQDVLDSIPGHLRKPLEEMRQRGPSYF